MSNSWLEGLKTLCKARCSFEKTGKHWSVFLDPETLVDGVRRLWDDGFFLEDVAVVDSADGFTVVYHFDHFDRPGRVALYVTVPHNRPEIPSISSVFSGAEWHERECHDFYGVRFSGHPGLTPLLLPEDMKLRPLIKQDKARVPLRDVVVPGEVVDQVPEFHLFEPDESVPDEGEPST